MPLIHSASDEAFRENVSEMYHAGHPLKQSLAAAYHNQDEARAPGGGIMAHPPAPMVAPSLHRQSRGIAHFDDGGGIMGGMGGDMSGGIGGVAPSTQSMNPQMQGVIQRYASLPTEKLQELAARLQGSPYSGIIQKILQQKQTQPALNAPPGQGGMPASPAAAPQLNPVLSAAPMGQRHGGKVQRRDFGGNISMGEGSPWWERSEARGMDSGYLNGHTLGRADSLKTTAPSGAYVIPADVVAGLGEGNSLAGARILEEALKTGPHGTPLPRGARGSGPPHGAVARPPEDFASSAYKSGGVPKDGPEGKVPVLLSHGEYVIHPIHVRRIGGGDLKKGHRILDEFVLHRRKKDIEKLKKLPGPVKPHEKAA